MTNTTLDPRWGETIYVDEQDRYIVTLAVGYDEETVAGDPELAWVSPVDRYAVKQEDKMKVALRAAIELTRGQEGRDTMWCVYDRVTGETRLMEQREAMR